MMTRHQRRQIRKQIGRKHGVEWRSRGRCWNRNGEIVPGPARTRGVPWERDRKHNKYYE